MLTLATASLLVPGCLLESNECVEGEARCEGSIAQVCMPYESGSRVITRWSSRDCSSGGGACVANNDAAGRPRAFCALAAETDARCTEPDGASCAGSSLVSCSAGYATAVSTCSSACVALDDMPDYCLENPPEEARCVTGDGCQLAGPSFSANSGSAPGATCSASEFGPVTNPNQRVYAYSCQNGLLAARHRCQSVCISTPSCTTHCGDESLFHSSN